MEHHQFETLKATLREQLASLSKRTLDTLLVVDAELQKVRAQDAEANQMFQRLDQASAKVPLGLLAYRYAKGLGRARGPVVLFDGSMNDEYEEVSEETFSRMRTTYIAPAVRAYTQVASEVEHLLSDVQNKALTLRFFSNSEPLLAQYAAVLERPWFVPIAVDDLTPKGSFRLHYAYQTLPYRLPPHIALIADRRAAVESLRLFQSKLRSLSSLIEVSMTELEFSQPRVEPAAVPTNWYDYSVKIGDNSAVEGSAIGSESTLGKGTV
jgi:hypothetical protein